MLEKSRTYFYRNVENLWSIGRIIILMKRLLKGYPLLIYIDAASLQDNCSCCSFLYFGTVPKVEWSILWRHLNSVQRCLGFCIGWQWWHCLNTIQWWHCLKTIEWWHCLNTIVSYLYQIKCISVLDSLLRCESHCNYI